MLRLGLNKGAIMPMYTYHCENCDHEFEKYQSFSENALTTCPNCEQETLYKVYKPALVVFKGSGFYVNDSKSNSSTLSSTNSKDNHKDNDKENSKDNNKSEEKVTDNKPEKKKAESKKKETASKS